MTKSEYLSEMEKCYESMIVTLEKQPKNLTTPYSWLNSNNECVKGYVLDWYNHLQNYPKFSEEEKEEIMNKIWKKQSNFMLSHFEKHFDVFLLY